MGESTTWAFFVESPPWELMNLFVIYVYTRILLVEDLQSEVVGSPA